MESLKRINIQLFKHCQYMTNWILMAELKEKMTLITKRGGKKEKKIKGCDKSIRAQIRQK